MVHAVSVERELQRHVPHTNREIVQFPGTFPGFDRLHPCTDRRNLNAVIPHVRGHLDGRR